VNSQQSGGRTPAQPDARSVDLSILSNPGVVQPRHRALTEVNRSVSSRQDRRKTPLRIITPNRRVFLDQRRGTSRDVTAENDSEKATMPEGPSTLPPRQGRDFPPRDPGPHLLNKALEEGGAGRLRTALQRRTRAIHPTPCQFEDRPDRRPTLLFAPVTERQSRDGIPRLEKILQIPIKPFRANGKAP